MDNYYAEGWGRGKGYTPRAEAISIQAQYTDGDGEKHVINGKERDGQVFWEQPEPLVPEPKPFDCPVCELVGFDCGAHGG